MVSLKIHLIKKCNHRNITEEYYNHLQDNQDYFLEEEEARRVNEALRLSKKRSLLNMFRSI